MKTIKENLLLKNEFVSVYNNDIEFKSNQKGTHFKVVSNDGASILPITNEGKVILIKNYKYAIDRAIIEIPRGTCDSNLESSTAAAKRELLEETGYEFDILTFLDVSRAAANVMTNCSNNYIAWGCHLSDESFTADGKEEIEEVLLLSPSEALALVMNGTIEDSDTARVILKFFQTLSPVRAEELDDKSSAYIMGAFCSRGKNEHYNPFRNRDDDSMNHLDWEAGMNHAKFSRVVK